jgi:polysaccharide biosynthesis/export protein
MITPALPSQRLWRPSSPLLRGWFPRVLRRWFAVVAVAMTFSWLAEPASAQFVTPAAPQESGPNLPAQPIGPNDLLAISVYGAPEFSRTVRVSEEGQIRLPMLHDKIAVLGMMPAELETRLAEAFEAAQILVDPAVTISIAEYHSHPISVVGAVRMPLTFQAVGRTSLVEAITRAQGLAEDAGAEIVITRTPKDGIAGGAAQASVQGSVQGSAQAIERVPVRGLIDGSDPRLNVMLEGGEEVRVPAIGRVFVVGNVTHPGGFRLDEAAGMSVLKALALSEGLAPFAAKLAYIYRRDNGAPVEMPVELRKIMDRKSDDVQLLANDILYVPDNHSKRTALTVVERMVGFTAGTASGALILGLH